MQKNQMTDQSAPITLKEENSSIYAECVNDLERFCKSKISGCQLIIKVDPRPDRVEAFKIKLEYWQIKLASLSEELGFFTVQQHKNKQAGQ